MARSGNRARRDPDLTSRRPIRSLRLDEEAPGAAAGWPWDLPVVDRLRAEQLELGPLTVLVGQNGTGKSTLLEGVALACGFSPEGGSTQARHSTRASESELWRHLRVTRELGASRWGYFLRAETMHGFFTYLEENPGGHDPLFHEMSHGESFVALVERRFDGAGLYLLDEPESALSFENCLALGGVLHELAGRGDAQVLLATHSPVLAAIPGARVLELHADGWDESAWEDLTMVANWRMFLADPRRYWRRIV